MPIATTADIWEATATSIPGAPHHWRSSWANTNVCSCGSLVGSAGKRPFVGCRRGRFWRGRPLRQTMAGWRWPCEGAVQEIHCSVPCTRRQSGGCWPAVEDIQGRRRRSWSRCSRLPAGGNWARSSWLAVRRHQLYLGRILTMKKFPENSIDLIGYWIVRVYI
jgi:hypothetical protein